MTPNNIDFGVHHTEYHLLWLYIYKVAKGLSSICSISFLKYLRTTKSTRRNVYLFGIGDSRIKFDLISPEKGQTIRTRGICGLCIFYYLWKHNTKTHRETGKPSQKVHTNKIQSRCGSARGMRFTNIKGGRV